MNTPMVPGLIIKLIVNLEGKPQYGDRLTIIVAISDLTATKK